MDDRFWEDGKGVKLDDLLKDRNELAAKVAKQADAPKAPASADEYSLDIPKIEGAPADFAFALDLDSPVTAELRAYAHQQNWSQEQVTGALSLLAKDALAQHTKLTAAVAKEMDSLGANGPARLDAIHSGIAALAGDEGAKALAPMLFTKAQVEAFEKVLAAAQSGGVPGFSGQGRGDGSPPKSAAQLVYPTDPFAK